MKYTIYDIAKLANTSVSTISRYLNHKPVTEENRIKIEKVLSNIDFKPNAMARALVSNSLKTVAIITVDIRVPHFASITYFFEQEFTKRGYHVIICNTSGSVEKAIDYLKMLLNTKIDGIAFVGSIFDLLNSNKEAMKLLKNIPVVVANGQLNLPNCYSVLCDDAYGVSQAVEYLFKKGRHNIFYINDIDTKSALFKIDGFVSTTKRLGIYDSSHVIKTNHSIDSGMQIIKNIIKNKEVFDAFICSDDEVAVGVINQLKYEGYLVGKEVDVIGYNNTTLSEVTIPKMTVINNKAEEEAKLLVLLLEKLINGDKTQSITIKPELIIKGSA